MKKTFVVAAGLLAAFFDLSRIAAMGAIFYLNMDIIMHWGVYRDLHEDVNANRAVLLTAILLDLVVLSAFLIMKVASDPMIIAISLGGIVLIFGFEKLYLRPIRDRERQGAHDDHA